MSRRNRGRASVTTKYPECGSRKLVRKYKRIMVMLLTCCIIGLAFPLTHIIDHKPVYKVMINGQLVAVAESEEEAELAYENARKERICQADGLVFMDARLEIKEAEELDLQALEQEELTSVLYSYMESCIVKDKVIGYTIKINDYTVTLESQDAVRAVLQETMDLYDGGADFEAALVKADYSDDSFFTVEAVPMNMQETEVVSVTSAKSVENTANKENDTEEINSTDGADNVEAGVEDQSDDIKEEIGKIESTQEEAQETVDRPDGIVGVGFEEEIRIYETFVNEEQLTDVETAVSQITKDTEKEIIYEVAAGDSLYSIATDHDMTLDELFSMNEGMNVDSNIFIGDEVVVACPSPELSVLVYEQKTYKENYYAEIEYVEDDNMYIGDSEVVQEAVAGKRKVTAVFTYYNGVEQDREILNQEILKAAVPQIIKTGTKARPTYIKPISNGTQTSSFGYRSQPTAGASTYHQGVDWGTPIGTAVKASRAGTVTSAGWMSGYGYCVIISHGDGVETRYGHLSSVSVYNGQTVNQGDKIALSGNTGVSTGPHLHFEIRINGTAVNPLDYLN